MIKLSKRFAYRDPETLSIDGVSDKEHFYKKIMQKRPAKASPRPLYNFGK